MFRTRIAGSTLVAVAGFALLSSTTPPATARQPVKDDLPRPSPKVREVANLKTQVPLANLAAAKEAFEAFAKFNAEYISHPKVYTAPQEFRTEPVPFTAPQPPKTLDEIITELSRHILVPVPGSRVGQDNADYIRELGAALDAALKPVIETHPEPIVRVNATRLLAAACRSGAHAHYPTVIELIKNANTRPEVKYYAFQAAANLLAAYDLSPTRIRQHSNKAAEMNALIAALQTAILDPNSILPAPPAGASRTREDDEVLTYIRRQAVRALAEVRYSDHVAKDSPDLYPAFTLARVAVSDPAIKPAPTETEIAEAIIGIANMSPPIRQQDAQQYGRAMADAVATGLITFATKRAANPQDKSVPWRSYAARLNEALKGWRPLFDPNFNPASPNAFLAALVPKPVEAVIGEADRRLLGPMENGGAVDLNGFRDFRNNSLRSDKLTTLAPFASDPKLVIPRRD